MASSLSGSSTIRTDKARHTSSSRAFQRASQILCHLNTPVRRLLAAATGCARDFTVSTVEVMGFATCPTSSIAPSTSRMPDLNALMPLAKSPITRGSFPAPNRIMTMAKTTSQCMMLNEPILQRPKERHDNCSSNTKTKLHPFCVAVTEKRIAWAAE